MEEVGIDVTYRSRDFKGKREPAFFLMPGEVPDGSGADSDREREQHFGIACS
jgi:hypothetical protein